MLKLHTRQADGLWLVTIAAVLWGTIGVATQAIYQIDSTTSLFINLARLVIATPLLFAFCWRALGRAMWNIARRDLGIMALTGALMALSHAAYFAAIREAGVTITTLLTICVAPLIVTGLSVLLKFETVTRRAIIALVCALIGAVLLVGFQNGGESGAGQALGALFSLAAAATYAGMIVCGRFLAASYHPLQVTTVTFGAGTLVLVIINLLAGVVAVQTVQGWGLVVYLGLVPTAFAYWLFQRGLHSVPATAASIVSMLDPLVAALLAWALFGETLAAAGFAGAVLLIGSIFLLSGEQGDKKSFTAEGAERRRERLSAVRAYLTFRRCSRRGLARQAPIQALTSALLCVLYGENLFG
jgi:DME family drug/metabolite transporter